MYLRILSVLIILTCSRISSSIAAVNITCEFGYIEDKYTVKISNQTYNSTEKGLKIYGRHTNRMKNPDVKILDASFRFNKLDIVPSTLLQIFVNLAELRMEKCGLKKLTANSFKYCGKIKVMKFGVDDIDIEAGVFKMCGNLEVLEFNGNNIKSIDNYAFKGLDKLQTLKMDKCNILTIDPELLLPLFYLEHIHITGNKFEELPNGLFYELEYLKTMNLSNNELISFSSSFIKRKNHLEILDLSENNIETLDRKFLENWPNNAALNMESNICMDKKFGRLGTNDLPMVEVVQFFMNCFEDERTIHPNYTSTTEEPKSSSKSSESSEQDSDEKLKTETKKIEIVEEKVDEKEQKEDSSEKAVSKKRESGENENVEKSGEKKETDVNKKDEESKEETNDKLVKPLLPSNNADLKDNENVENFRDSPFEFAKETTDSIKQNSSEKVGDKESNESTITVVHEKSSSESDSDEDSDEKTTEISTTESTTTTTEATTKKHKKKGKKGKATTEVVTESTVAATQEETTVSQDETNLEIATKLESVSESETTEGIEEMITATEIIIQETTEKVEEKDQLHDYEQATCRFYLDADKNYNCELVNVTQYLKRINTAHFDGYTNEQVNGIFFRQSKLFQVPRIVSITFPNLIELSIENTNLKVMDDEFIEDCGNIKRINLRNNKIRRVERNSLKACLNLEHVDLSGNPIETIEGGIFDCNPQLSLTFNAMKILPVSHSEKP